MSATKAKPVGRAVRVMSAIRINCDEWYECPRPHGRDDESGHIITGYTGSAKTLKRLVEIAGMDPIEARHEIWTTFWRGYEEAKHKDSPLTEGMDRVFHLLGLGLSPAQGRKGHK